MPSDLGWTMFDALLRRVFGKEKGERIFDALVVLIGAAVLAFRSNFVPGLRGCLGLA